MRVWEGRTIEPVRWSLFGAGGVLASLTMAPLVLVFGLLAPLGMLGGPDETYARVYDALTHPVVAFAVCLGLGVVLWHCCHRVYHALHDLRIHPPEIVRAGIYGAAVLTPAMTYVLCLTS